MLGMVTATYDPDYDGGRMLRIVAKLQRLLSLQLEQTGGIGALSEGQWSEYKAREQEIEVLLLALQSYRKGSLSTRVVEADSSVRRSA